MMHSGTQTTTSAYTLFRGPGIMRARCRSFDWAGTPLGDVNTWPASLTTTALTVLGGGFPMILLWGPELVQIFNDGYLAFLGAKKDSALGQPTRECWPEVWHINAPIYERVLAGETVTLEEAHFPLLRDGPTGPVEDLYITLSYSPLPDGEGRVGGVLVTLTDATAVVCGRAERERLEAMAEAARVDAESRAATMAAVFQSIPDALLVSHPRGVFLANDAALKVLGVPAEKVGKSGLLNESLPFDELLCDHETGAPLPIDVTPIGRAFTGARSHGQFLLNARGTGGKLLPIRAAAAPVIAPSGDVTGVVAVLTDMSSVHRAAAERERLLHALKVERARLAYVFQHAPAFLAVLRGPTHVFELANDAYYELIGRRPIVGKPLADALPEVRDQGFLDLIDGVLSTGEPFVGREVPIRLARTVGSEPESRFVDFVYLPIVEADGSRSGVIAHGTDVTEQVGARREIERLLRESEHARADAETARVEAEAANRGKSEFLAVMSHELRTPLNAIGGYAQLLSMGLRGPVTEAQLSDLQRIQTSQDHLLALINRVLNYAMIDAGVVTYEVTDVRLDELLSTCETLVAPQATAKQITLAFSECDTQLRARADQEKVRQVVLNLLSNALKFTEPGGRVSLSCAAVTRDEGAPQIGIQVTDTGRGIALDQQEAIFQPFVQVDARLTRTQEGTGLGLAISRELARGMGGDLTVESTQGVGSTFTFLLPAA